MTTIKVLKENIIADLIEQGDQVKNGIIIMDDNGKDRGIRPRWCRVFKVGPDIEDVKEGDWVLVTHGEWSYGMDATFDGKEATYRWVKYSEILGVQDEMPEGLNFG